MKVYFGSDHHGENLRPMLVYYVRKLGYLTEDLGMNIDFPVMAQNVSERVLEYAGNMGILICGTGQGISIAANRNRGIRAADCRTVADARQAREQLDANILAIGADHVGYPLAKNIVYVFLTTEFTGEERYKRRIKQMDDL
jgi:ribose 5-phosphate isomerase B